VAKSEPIINSFTKYLKTEFSQQKDCDLSDILDANKSRVHFGYLEVKSAMLKLKTVDPELHKLLCYLWLSYRSRNYIANSLYMDSSTLRRRWVKALNILLNYLLNAEVTAELDPIDPLYIEAKERGMLGSL